MLTAHPANNPNCCTGTHNTPATCPPTGVQFYSYFSASPQYIRLGFFLLGMLTRPARAENACRDSYAYAYDESSGTALWTCPSSKNADYTVTFCP